MTACDPEDTSTLAALTVANTLPQLETMSGETMGGETMSGAIAPPSPVSKLASAPKLTKDAIRTSLQASTLDDVFATLFSNVTTGVLLTNFLLELGASALEIGLLTAIPMLANLVQPIGAHLSQKTSSLYAYGFWMNGTARLMWWVLAIGIGYSVWYSLDAQILIRLTLITALASALLAALSSASWLSWMVILVPRRLRGRYFSIRSSAANLTSLIAIPAAGWLVSQWQGGSIEGFGMALVLATIAGLLSIICQSFMTDVNPQAVGFQPERSLSSSALPLLDRALPPNQMIFLVYVSFWLFAVNIGTPFYNLYMLDVLHIDIAKVSVYNSFTAGANLLLLVGWGKLADRIGNRPILLGSGIVVAITPLFWLGTDASSLSVWLWLPGLHLLIGGTSAAIDLCLNNLQISVAPLHNPASYFGMVAAISGVTGALGTLTGGFLAQSWHPDGLNGLLAVFVLSSFLRLLAMLPLLWVQESDRLPVQA